MGMKKLARSMGVPNCYQSGTVSLAATPYRVLRAAGTSFALTAAQTQTGYIVQSPRAGTIDAIVIDVGAFTSGGNTIFALEGPSATGTPSGTLLAAGASATINITAVGRYEGLLTTPVTVVEGQVIALTVKPASGTRNFQLHVTNRNAGGIGFPYCVYAAAWTKSGILGPYFLFRYTDGTYHKPHGSIAQSMNEGRISFDLSTSPDEVGNRFVLPYTCISDGVYCSADYNIAGDFILYDDTGTQLRTFTIDPDFASATSGATFYTRWLSPVTLNKGRSYRIVYRPSVTGTDTLMGSFIYASAAEKNAFISTDMTAVGTTRTNAGAWTDTALTVYAIGVTISHINIPGQKSSAM